MNIDIYIGEDRLQEGPPAQMEPVSRPPSVVSSDSSDTHYDNEDYAGDLWDELDVLLQAQEDDFVERDDSIPTSVLFEAPAAPIVKGPSMPMSPNISFQHQSAVPGLVSGPSIPPSVPHLNPPLGLLSPMRPVGTDLKGECKPHASSPHLHMLLLSQGASVAGQSARTEPARESPSCRFFASPDQIDALGTPRTWVHGQVISTLGDMFCYPSHSKPRNQRYETLPTNLFDLWNSSMEGHIASRTCLSFHFKQVVSPLECRAWLIPVLLEHHWYLLEFNWIDHAIHIYDSFAIPQPRLVGFGEALLNLIAEDFELIDQDWNIVPEQVSGVYYSVTRP